MTPTNDQLIAEAKEQPAPLLPLLHRFHERDGYLSEEALRAVSKALRRRSAQQIPSRKARLRRLRSVGSRSRLRASPKAPA